MNGRMAKKIRKAAKERDKTMMPRLKAFCNKQGFFSRVKLSWRLLLGRF